MKLHSYRIVLLLGFPLAASAEPITTVASEMHAAADHPDAETHFQLARKLLAGDGVPKDEKKAFDLMKAAADQGHADAIGGLGYFYSIGLVVPKDDMLAIEWFRKGAEKGSAKSQLNLGKMLLEGKAGAAVDAESSRLQGLQWIAKSADQGLPEAQLSYGKILYFGDHGQPQDYKKAMIYLKPTAVSGMAEAQNMLGSMYECGSGIPVDPTAALRWYRKAAMHGNSRAQANLGMLMGPLGANKEVRIEALAWLLMASQQQQVTAVKALADATPALKAGELDEAVKKQAELTKLVKK